MLEFRTSESVNIGHPDKTCDTIADSFLDAALKHDKNSQMAVECAIKNNKLFIYGEATTQAKIDYEKIARKVLKQVGYKAEDFEIIKEISEQSPDINQAVVREELCANDQGIVIGYATNETPEYMPLTLVIAHKIMAKYETFRNQPQNKKRYFSDAKAQVTVAYENDVPKFIKEIVISVSHSEKVESTELTFDIKEEIIKPLLYEYGKYWSDNTSIEINPSGKFTIWGSFGDSGCVGRKIVVDSYGGQARVGGGCFSSKNATKVDRSAAYYARYVAKNIVAHKLARKCEIELAYVIGQAKPVAIKINCFKTNRKSMNKIYDIVNKNFDFSVSNIIKELDLLKPIYAATTNYGHFGRDLFTWEQIKDLEK